MRAKHVWIGIGSLVGVGVLAGVGAIAAGPMELGEFFSMLRLGLRASMQEEPDYDAVDAAVIETGVAPAAASAPEGAGLPPPYWTDFRGPGRLGSYDETPIRTDWPPEGLPLRWRRPAGAAYGSLTVAHGRVFSLEQRRDEETLVAYDFDTGRELWAAGWAGRFEESTSGEGPRATPVWTALETGADSEQPIGSKGSTELVLAVGATGVLRTFDASSGVAGWSFDLFGEGRAGASEPPVRAANLLYGLSASPLVLPAGGGRPALAIVPTGIPKDGGGSLLALELASGALVWRAVTDAAAYASPLAVALGGVPQVVYASATLVSGVDPATGEVLWSHPWEVMQELNCSQPLAVDGQHLLMNAGYGKGSALLRIERTPAGWSANEVWKSPRFKPRFNPPVLFEGHVYGLDEGVLACLEPLTGERLWKDGRYGLGQLLLAQGHLFVLDEDGALALVRASPEGREELARFQAIEGLTLSIPAAAHGRLFVRNKLELACFELAPEDAR